METSPSKYFVAALTFTLLLISTSAATGKTSNEFIKTSCRTTTYPNLCFTSLSTHATTIQTSPKLLAHTALSVTLDTARSTSTVIFKLSKTHGLTPREAGAMKDCVEVLSDSVGSLSDSLEAMTRLGGSRNFEFELIISDVQTWVSAALTDEDTCVEGFDGEAMDGKLKNIVRGRIVNVAHLTSNALALINRFAVHG